MTTSAATQEGAAAAPPPHAGAAPPPQQLAAVASVAAGATPDSIVVRALTFALPTSGPLISDLTLELPRGSRCLLCGANGAGERGGEARALDRPALSILPPSHHTKNAHKRTPHTTRTH